MIREYLKRIRPLFQYLFSFYQFKKLDIRAIIYFSVRVDGKKYISIGRNSVIQRGGWLFAMKLGNETPSLDIGDNCSIGDYCHIAAIGKITLKNDVLIANNVYISDNIHEFKDINTPIQNQPIVFKGEVILGQGCWIGENVCIIGASVGRNSVVGANSVVTKNIDDYCVAVGSPAKIIKRFNFDKKEWVSVN